VPSLPPVGGEFADDAEAVLAAVAAVVVLPRAAVVCDFDPCVVAVDLSVDGEPAAWFAAG
jgi:hypothetical protein